MPRGLIWAMVAALLAALPARAQERHALVVGIDAYEALPPLTRAVNDARAVAATLERLGFAVTLAVNPGRRAMNQALNEFARALRPGDEAVFYFAGHGVEIAGRNWLLPADVPAALAGQEAFVTGESIAVDVVLETIRARGTRVSLLILDACRDNPFPAPPGRGAAPLGGGRGLGAMTAPEGTFILYSAAIGQQALDALGRSDPDPNSVFTRRLLPLMAEPGLPLPELARRLRTEVQALAATVGHVQRPAYYDELTGSFSFAPAAAPPAAGAPVAGLAGIPGGALAAAAAQAAASEALYREARDLGQCYAYDAYLSACPAHPFRAMAEAFRAANCTGAAPAPAAAPATLPPPAPALPPGLRGLVRLDGGAVWVARAGETVKGVAMGLMLAPRDVAAHAGRAEGAALAEGEVLPLPRAEPTCQDLWVVRNTYFADAGLCFQTERARAYFGTDCRARQVTLPAAEARRVDEIRALERARGC